MRILQLCPKVPWPPDDGGRLAMRVLALSLRRAGAEVRTLSPQPRKHRADRRPCRRRRAHLRLEAIDIDTSITAPGAIKSLLPGSSYNVDRFVSQPFEQRIGEILLEERPDIVVLESLFMVPYVPALRRETCRQSSSAPSTSSTRSGRDSRAENAGSDTGSISATSRGAFGSTRSPL